MLRIDLSLQMLTEDKKCVILVIRNRPPRVEPWKDETRSRRISIRKKFFRRRKRTFAKTVKTEEVYRKMDNRKMLAMLKPCHHVSANSFASFAPLRENTSSLRTNSRKPCQSGTIRATHLLSRPNSRGPQGAYTVPNCVKPVTLSDKRVPLVPNLALCKDFFRVFLMLALSCRTPPITINSSPKPAD